MSDLKPIAHLVWGQYRRAADDVEDYYEVAYRPDHKSVDGSDPFPVWDCPPDVASLTAERDRLREENERLRKASWRLMIAADAVDLGRSIHNSRKPDQAIEGPVWGILRDASAAVRSTLEGDAS